MRMQTNNRGHHGANSCFFACACKPTTADTMEQTVVSLHAHANQQPRTPWGKQLFLCMRMQTNNRGHHGANSCFFACACKPTTADTMGQTVVSLHAHANQQ